jgi:hypothetical protein
MRFGSRLFRTWLAAPLGAAALVAAGTACQGNVARSAGSTSTGGASGTTSEQSTSTTGTGGASGTTSVQSASTTGAGGHGGGQPAGPVRRCFDWVDAGPCPTSASEVLFQLDMNGCNGASPPQEASSVVSGPTSNAGGQCCYGVVLQVCMGG